jgi:deoxyribodipyrimidine photo-lyase
MRDRPDGGAFVRKLCWRDFFLQLLAANPSLPREDLRPRRECRRDDDEALARWREGTTGYPIVDAGMRQLAREGWLSNRARLIVASFLTKTLEQDWRHGAEHFASLLVDADVANNVGNWQWMAGTGVDTRPNRVLNPVRQAKRHDADGAYARRYVRELADIPPAHVHEPWKAPAAEAPRGYPAPIDHVGAAAA